MSRRVKLAFVLSVVAVAGAGFGVVRLRRYVDEDPRLCASCHRTSPEFALWTKGSHRSVACQRCHHATPEQGLAMLRAFLAGKSPDGEKPHAPVEVGACARCHLSHDPQWPQIEGSRGHKVHIGAAKIECTTCHASAVHGFEPVVASCKRCHGDHAVRGGVVMRQLHCFACHNFLSADAGLSPTRRDCLRCHRAEGVLPARFADDAPMQFDCGSCHKPHAPPGEERVACAKCHEGVARAGLHANAGHRACGQCHAAHVWRAEEKGCASCHAGAAAHARARRCGECHAFGGAGRPASPRPL
jgi:LSD1 subclass zinc finger protein